MTNHKKSKRRFIETASGDEYVHKLVWLVAKRQLEHAEDKPRGAQLDHLVAMVFASHVLEGYANFLGEKIIPNIWKDERILFAKTGLAGKLKTLHQECGLAMPAKGRRPWSTVRELKRLRDGIAHPRTQTTTKITEYVDGKQPPMFAKSWLDGFVTAQKASRALEDVKMIADALHTAAMARFAYAGLLSDALEGILSMRSTSAHLKE